MKKFTKKTSRGISLIEVLISIVVMTFGLLGISGLMMAGVNNSTGSDLASRANQSAIEIMDAMRANRGNAANYVIAYTTLTSTLTGTTPQDVDRKQWREIIERLPGGGGAIETVAGTANTYKVLVRFSNCLGTLSADEKTKCASSTVGRREIEYTFQI